MNTSTFCLLLLLVACTPAQQTVAGGGIAIVGAGVTVLAVESMARPCRQTIEPRDVCTEDSEPTSPSVGIPAALGGLGVVALGGLIMATAGSHGDPPPARKPAPVPAEKPTELDESEAVAMVTARVLVNGVDRRAPSRRLLDVDDRQVRLHVQDGHAELWNLRVRTAANETWHFVSACFVFEGEWRVTSLGTTTSCAR